MLLDYRKKTALVFFAILSLWPLVSLPTENRQTENSKTEKAETKPAEIVINAPGLEDAAVNNARFFMQLASENCETPRWKINKLFGQVEQQVTTSLHAFGYYHPVISKQIKWEENCWKVTVDIEQGEPVIIEAVDIKLIGAT